MNTVSIGEGFGRVNLIGEHLDYNGGHVLPLQIKNSIICEIVENKNSESISIVSDKYKDSLIVKKLEKEIIGQISLLDHVFILRRNFQLRLTISQFISKAAFHWESVSLPLLQSPLVL